MKKRKTMPMQGSNADYREEKNSDSTRTVSKPTRPLITFPLSTSYSHNSHSHPPCSQKSALSPLAHLSTACSASAPIPQHYGRYYPSRWRSM